MRADSRGQTESLLHCCSPQGAIGNGNRPPRRRFEYCPSCDAVLFANDRRCPECGLDLQGRTAEQLERMRVVR